MTNNYNLLAKHIVQKYIDRLKDSLENNYKVYEGWYKHHIASYNNGYVAAEKTFTVDEDMDKTYHIYKKEGYYKAL